MDHATTPEALPGPVPTPAPGAVPPGGDLLRGAHRLLALVVAIAAAGTVAAALAGHGDLAAGIAAGGGLCAVNFWLLARIAFKVVARDGGGKAGLLLRVGVKYGVLAAATAGCLFVLGLDPVGFLVGLSLLFPAVLIYGAMDLFR